MIREIHENELKGLLELYLHLHESDVPDSFYTMDWIEGRALEALFLKKNKDGNFASKLNLFSYVYCDKRKDFWYNISVGGYRDEKDKFTNCRIAT